MKAVDRYRSALRAPGVRRVVAATFLGRLVTGGMTLALLLTAAATTGSFATAGTVLGGYAIALTVGGPLWGRAADRWGARRILLQATLLQSAFFALFLVAAIADASWPVLLAAAALAGAATPPGSSVARNVLATAVIEDQDRRAIFSLDSLSTESGFIIGPLLVAAVVAVLGPVPAVAVTATLAAAGTLWLASAGAVRELRSVATGPSGLSGGGIRRHGGILLVIAVSAVTFGALEVSVVAHAVDIRASAGVLFAVQAAGGVLGGLLYGALKLPGSYRLQLIVVLLLFGGFILPLALLPGFLLSAAILLSVGLVSGPADVLQSLLVAESSAPESRSELFALLNSASWIGFSTGAVVAGALVDRSVASGMLTAGAATIAAGLLLAVVRSGARQLPVT